jgi:hypothetical protein
MQNRFETGQSKRHVAERVAEHSKAHTAKK